MRTTALVLLALVTTSCVTPAPRVDRGPPGPSRLGASEAIGQLVRAHNRERTRAGLNTLAVNDSLRTAAGRHADDMAARKRMSHRGGDGSPPFRRMSVAGYRHAGAAENVAAGQTTVGEVMADWMSSPGHKRNILGRFTEIGAGYATDAGGTPYWCVTFGTPAGG